MLTEASAAAWAFHNDTSRRRSKCIEITRFTFVCKRRQNANVRLRWFAFRLVSLPAANELLSRRLIGFFSPANFTERLDKLVTFFLNIKVLQLIG